MRSALIIGVSFVVIGVAGFAVGQVTYTTREPVVVAGPQPVIVEKQHTIGIPPRTDLAAVVAGLVLVLFGLRRV